MKDNYIKIPAIYKKLKQAETEERPLYLSAPVGYGKTVAVRYYYRKKAVLWISGESGEVDQDIDPDKISQGTVVIDDISWIIKESSKEYIIGLLAVKKLHVIMIGRAKLPNWLKAACIKYQFIVANRGDLELGVDQTRKLLEEYDVLIPEKEVQELHKDTKGHGLSIVLTAYQLQNRQHYDESIRQAARIDEFHYFNTAFYEKWSVQMRTLLMSVSTFDRFTTKMAEMITGDEQVQQLLDAAMAVGNFIVRHEDGTYELMPMLRKFMIWKQQSIGNKEERLEIMKRAGLYYELTGQIEEALNYYKLAGRHQDISRLLIKNANNHVGTGHYYGTRSYYMELKEEGIMESPVLITGMSMLYSLLLQPEKSEYWYDKLKKLEDEFPRDSSERKEARRRLSYLDIALPHMGTVSVVNILKNAAIMITDRKMKMPDFSVTSNLPSIMNGGKDFYDWSRIDKELAITTCGTGIGQMGGRSC